MTSRSLALIALLTALTLLLPAAAAQSGLNAAAASGYEYPFSVDDAEGDHLGLSGTPNVANPENDIRKLEITDDGDHLIVRITMATMTFGTPSGSVTVSLELTGPQDADDWEVTVAYQNGGTNMVVGDYDPADPNTPDADVLLPGVWVELVPANATIYFFAPHAETKLDFNDTVRVDELQSGRGASASTALGDRGITQPNRDVAEEAAGKKHAILLGAFGPLPEQNPSNDTQPADEGGDSPAAGLLLIAGAFAAAAVVVRRRK